MVLLMSRDRMFSTWYITWYHLIFAYWLKIILKKQTFSGFVADAAPAAERAAGSELWAVNPELDAELAPDELDAAEKKNNHLESQKLFCYDSSTSFLINKTNHHRIPSKIKTSTEQQKMPGTRADTSQDDHYQAATDDQPLATLQISKDLSSSVTCLGSCLHFKKIGTNRTLQRGLGAAQIELASLWDWLSPRSSRAWQRGDFSGWPREGNHLQASRRYLTVAAK